MVLFQVLAFAVLLASTFADEHSQYDHSTYGRGDPYVHGYHRGYCEGDHNYYCYGKPDSDFKRVYQFGLVKGEDGLTPFTHVTKKYTKTDHDLAHYLPLGRYETYPQELGSYKHYVTEGSEKHNRHGKGHHKKGHGHGYVGLRDGYEHHDDFGPDPFPYAGYDYYGPDPFGYLDKDIDKGYDHYGPDPFAYLSDYSKGYDDTYEDLGNYNEPNHGYNTGGRTGSYLIRGTPKVKKLALPNLFPRVSTTPRSQTVSTTTTPRPTTSRKPEGYHRYKGYDHDYYHPGYGLPKEHVFYEDYPSYDGHTFTKTAVYHPPKIPFHDPALHHPGHIFAGPQIDHHSPSLHHSLPHVHQVSFPVPVRYKTTPLKYIGNPQTYQAPILRAKGHITHAGYGAGKSVGAHTLSQHHGHHDGSHHTSPQFHHGHSHGLKTTSTGYGPPKSHIHHAGDKYGHTVSPDAHGHLQSFRRREHSSAAEVRASHNKDNSLGARMKLSESQPTNLRS